METLTIRSVRVRPVLVPLRRPIVSRVGHFDEWPLVLVDIETDQGITGRSYVEPYLRQAARYLVPAIRDLVESRIGQPMRPLDEFRSARKSLNLIGYEGLAMIAVSARKPPDCRSPNCSAEVSGPCRPTTATDCGSETLMRWERKPTR